MRSLQFFSKAQCNTLNGLCADLFQICSLFVARRSQVATVVLSFLTPIHGVPPVIWYLFSGIHFLERHLKAPRYASLKI